MKSRSIKPNSLGQQVFLRPIERLSPFPDNARLHPDSQIIALARSIRDLGFIKPIIIDESDTILAGHGCWEAAKRLSLKEVPTITISGLSEGAKRALVIADNRLGEKSIWDTSLLKVHFKELTGINFDVELTGFTTGEIDIHLDDSREQRTEPVDVLKEADLAGPAVSADGDPWVLGRHRLICSDARTARPYHALLGAELAQMIVTDPPYNVRIQKHARGRSQKKQREFAMASGEMSSPQFIGFLETVMNRAIEFSAAGSIHYWFIDWRHLPEILRASTALYSEWKNLLVWRKSNAGQGAFYRSQHELIAVFKAGKAPHINNFGLGAEGRNRTNVLDYPGGATPDSNRQQELAMHPTVKPVALIADLMRDCSKRNGLVLDLFGGSGTSILAAELTGRCARVIEIDPLYVDLSIRRWQLQTGEKAVHAVSGETFEELAAQRCSDE